MQEVSRMMSEQLNSEKKNVKRTVKGGKILPASCGMAFCHNCSGSGRFFYGTKGVSVCQVCGGFGLVRAEMNCVHETKSN
jgi:hypothetical protein